MEKFLKLISALVALVVVIIGVGYFALLPKHSGDKTINVLPDKLFGWKFPVAKFPATGNVGTSLAYSDIRDPGGIPQGLPVRLKIPVIGVDSAIEDALVTSDGRMDVPAGSVNVAWFSLGPHPGQIGSAVIGGHFGIQNSVPFVFYNLDKLKPGENVYILDDKGNTLAFVVRSVVSFDRNADATTVFTSHDGLAHLNLITCEGIWNQVNGNYPQRLVVFTDAIPSQGAITVNPKIPSKVISPPTSKPSETAAPTSSPITKIGDLGNQQNLVSNVSGLFDTPVDGFATSLLLISIVFMIYKIIRR